jgi:tetratricopeptide (TPR) repeat protein
MNKKMSSFGLGILMLAALCGCAVQDSNIYTTPGAGTNSGAAYQPKSPPGIESLAAAKADLAALLGNRQRSVGITFGSGKYYSERDINLRANLPELDILLKGVNLAGTSLTYDSNNRLRYIELKSMTVLDDRIEISPRITFYYADLMDGLISVTISEDKSPYIYTVHLRDQLSFHFHKGNLTDAQRFADDLFFIRQMLKKQHDERLALFESKAAAYRALTVKPPVSEEQREYIVQANALNQKKDYAGALDLYLKAVEIDPTSYPGAYFNMALLSAQVKRFDSAISYMKQYLLLVPDAKDARSAQDKVYEWKLMLKK